MKLNDALARLRPFEDRFRRRGVSALYVFVSVARNAAADSSDIDLAFNLPEGTRFNLFDQAELQVELSEALNTRVDLVPLGAMRPSFRRRIETELVRVF
jgi:predicted nucleotidyltransferase